MKIPVMEIFGPTIQGEGMVIGQKTMFVRTAGCDYRCAWCDSRFTWDGSEKSTLMTAGEIVERLKAIGGTYFSHVTISGGNPVLHKGIGALVKAIKQEGWKVAIETQGSLWQDWLCDVDEVTLSPKPPSSKMDVDLETLDTIIAKLSRSDAKYSMKIVVFDDRDFQFAKEMYERYRSVPFFLQVGNAHTEEADKEQFLHKLLERYEWLIDKTVHSDMNDVKVLPQLHTLVWGNKRGV